MYGGKWGILKPTQIVLEKLNLADSTQEYFCSNSEILIGKWKIFMLFIVKEGWFVARDLFVLSIGDRQ